MDIVTRYFEIVSSTKAIRIVPLGDVHIGVKACDEPGFAKICKYILDTEDVYWVGMGDACDFVNMKDPRFSPSCLADWVKVSDLADLAGAQVRRFLFYTKPIAHKCLTLLKGNHETAIMKHSERDVFGDIVSGLKVAAGHPDSYKLDLGYAGWLRLVFHKKKSGSKKGGGTSIVHINLHHGFVGGRLDGAKALNMQRWMWNHRAHLTLFGHSHNIMSQVTVVEEVDRTGSIRYFRQVGAYTGTFLRSTVLRGDTYSEMKGYFPLPTGNIEVEIRPFTGRTKSDLSSGSPRITVMTH